MPDEPATPKIHTDGPGKRCLKGAGKQAEIHAGAAIVILDSINERMTLGLADQEIAAIALSLISGAAALGKYLRNLG